MTKRRGENDKIEEKRKEGRSELNAQYTLSINAHHSPDLDPFSFAQNSHSEEIRCQHCCSHMKTASMNLNSILSLSLSLFTVLYHLNINNGHYRHFRSFSSLLFWLNENENRGYLTMSEPFFYFSSISMFELESIDLTLRLRPRICPAGKSLNGVVCIEHPLIRRPSQVTYTHIEYMPCNAIYLEQGGFRSIDVCDDDWTAWMLELSLSSLLLAYTNWNVQIDWSSNIISFALQFNSWSTKIKCCWHKMSAVFSLILIFLSLNRYVYRYSWFLSLSTMCTNNFLWWTHWKRERERKKEGEREKRRQKCKHQSIWYIQTKRKKAAARDVYSNEMYLFKWHIFE